MIISPTSRPAADEFALSSGLLRGLVLDRVPIERLAARYGLSAPGLRLRLLDHIGACLVAINGPEPVEPKATPAVSPAKEPAPPPVRIRERVQSAPLAASASAPRMTVAELAPIFAEIRAAGAASQDAVADALSARGVPTARGGKAWNRNQVRAVEKKIAAAGGTPVPGPAHRVHARAVGAA